MTGKRVRREEREREKVGGRLVQLRRRIYRGELRWRGCIQEAVYCLQHGSAASRAVKWIYGFEDPADDLDRSERSRRDRSLSDLVPLFASRDVLTTGTKRCALNVAWRVVASFFLSAPLPLRGRSRWIKYLPGPTRGGAGQNRSSSSPAYCRHARVPSKYLTLHL